MTTVTRAVTTQNTTDRTIVGSATYNVTPLKAGIYFNKVECFCFTEQLLGAGESREMPVYFYIKPDLPEHIEDITLSYTFYQTDLPEEHAAVALPSQADATTN